MQTRAALFEGVGRPFAVRPIAIEEPGPGDVRVRMRAAGVCGSDLHVVRGEWTRATPMVLGHEGAGEVESVRRGRRDRWRSRRPRRRLVEPRLRRLCGPAAPGGPPPACRCAPDRGRDAARRHDAPLGRRRARLPHDGRGRVRRARADAAARGAADPRRPALSEAALLGCAALTGVGAALEAAAIPPGGAVAIVGAGGVGQFIVQGARIAGAGTIVAADPAQARREDALRAGATHAVAPDALLDVLAEITDGGADVTIRSGRIARDGGARAGGGPPRGRDRARGHAAGRRAARPRPGGVHAPREDADRLGLRLRRPGGGAARAARARAPRAARPARHGRRRVPAGADRRGDRRGPRGLPPAASW